LPPCLKKPWGPGQSPGRQLDQPQTINVPEKMPIILRDRAQ